LDLIADGTSLATAGSAPEAALPPDGALLLDAAVLVAPADEDADDEDELLLLPHPTAAVTHSANSAAESQPLQIRIKLLRNRLHPQKRVARG
jgi:hypothetical protein